jgi:hypothetical protein
MATKELDDVTALLERVLPDPAGFADRLLSQLLSRWGLTGQQLGSSVTADRSREQDDSEKVVIAPSFQPESWDALVDSNVLLASALGACDCWGLQSDCVVCKGAGSSGWTQPDIELFQAFVGPAVDRLSDTDRDVDELRFTTAHRNQDPTREGEGE